VTAALPLLMRSPLETLETNLWQLYGRVYDELLHLQPYVDLVSRVAQAAIEAESAGRVLELGCGSGNVMRQILLAGNNDVVGVDLSSSMLDVARRKLSGPIASGRAQVHRAPALEFLIGQPTAGFEVVVAQNFLYTQPERESMWKQIERVLAPGGRVVVAHTDRPGFGPIVAEQHRQLGLRGFFHPGIYAVAAVDLVIDSLAARGRYDFSPIDVLIDEARLVGLDEVKILGRCYGGADGVNVLATFTRS